MDNKEDIRIILRILSKSTGWDTVFDEVREEWEHIVCLGKGAE